MNNNFMFPVYSINDHRTEDSPFGFNTRGIDCPDGMTYMVTLPLHMWDWWDFFAEHNMPIPVEEKIENAWSAALHCYELNSNEDSFKDLFCMFLYQNINLDHQIYNGMNEAYKVLLKDKPIEGLNNINWQPQT